MKTTAEDSPVPARPVAVNDTRVDWVSGQRRRFASAILPRLTSSTATRGNSCTWVC